MVIFWPHMHITRDFETDTFLLLHTKPVVNCTRLVYFFIKREGEIVDPPKKIKVTRRLTDPSNT